MHSLSCPRLLRPVPCLPCRWGLFISKPRNVREADGPFPEPAMFLLNPEGYVHICEYSNSPFSRPDLRILIEGKRDVPLWSHASLRQLVWGSELCSLGHETEGVAVASVAESTPAGVLCVRGAIATPLLMP